MKEHENARKQSEEKHMSEMQSTRAQITRMQELIDGGSNREFQQLAEVYIIFFSHRSSKKDEIKSFSAQKQAL